MLKPEAFDNRPSTKKNKLSVLPANPEADDPTKVVGKGRFPSWLHRKLPSGTELWHTGNVLTENRLHTVCEEAKCPNLLECWSKKTATFLVMGKTCTRACGFCSIDFSKNPAPLEVDEPERVADSVKKLGLRHVVITLVARDDLPDQGAHHLVKIIETVRESNPECVIEVLTSDFHGNLQALDRVLAAGPEIFNHNIETVRELTPRVRHKATYEGTLLVLRHAKDYGEKQGLLIKSGLMVGLGETEAQVKETLRDLHGQGCDIITIGQYLQADPKKLLVKEFVTPEQFKKYEEYGYHLGVKQMYCGPFVRSSYHANEVLRQTNKK